MKELKEKVIQFRNERNWSQFQIQRTWRFSLEASELLENFQWKTSEEAIEERISDIKDELEQPYSGCFFYWGEDNETVGSTEETCLRRKKS
ncbi:hypothetical protein ACQKOM_21905 [Peribacillus frigoritolerans]|uniref:hypothetical protein n=1 Tax=Peribacillus frigoritolerans TaxID=450367 RepID=UPI003D00422D